MENVVFAFDNVNFFTKYRNIILYACLGITAIVFLILFIRAFAVKTRTRGFRKFGGILLRLLVACGVTALLLGGTYWLKSYNADVFAQYEHYKKAEKNGEVLSVEGKVEEFASYSEHKIFVVDGVEFTVYNFISVKEHLAETESKSPIFYLYTKQQTITTYVNGATSFNTVPEKCLISANQQLHLDYIEENGMLRILRIIELG